MNLDFLDFGLPVVPGNEEAASETMRKYREYCESLGKKRLCDLTEEELEDFRNMQCQNGE